ESCEPALSGRVALVTGAGRGIGRSTALTPAGRGARVMAVARTESDLAQLAAEAPVEYLVASVETPKGCAEIVAETRRRLGPVEILVNNAGIDTGREQPVWDQPDDVWEQTLRVNLSAPFQLTRAAAPDMTAHGFGRIVM